MRLIAGLSTCHIESEITNEQLRNLRICLRDLKDKALCIRDVSAEETKKTLTEANKISPDFGKLLEALYLQLSFEPKTQNKLRDLVINGEFPSQLIDKIFGIDFEEFLDYRREVIEPGDSVKDFWLKAVHPIAQHAKKVILVDKFAAEQFANRKSRSGLAKLANLLRESGVSNLEVCSSDAENLKNINSEYDGILNTRGKLVPMKIQLKLVSTSRFPHDRHIRFILPNNLTYAFSLGNGAEIFSSEKFADAFTFNEISEREWQSREELVNSESRVRYIEVSAR
jgi:hypothetical protein